MRSQKQNGFPGSSSSPPIFVLAQPTFVQGGKYFHRSETAPGLPRQIGDNQRVVFLGGAHGTQIPASYTGRDQTSQRGIFSYWELPLESPSYFFANISHASSAAPSISLRQGNSTILWVSVGLQRGANDDAEAAVARVLDLADQVDFEDGIENEFTKKLRGLVREYGGVALETLARTLFLPEIRTGIVVQSLLCLGRTDDAPSYPGRSWVLQRGLLSTSAKVRDAATVGICSLADVRAIGSLEAAASKESVRSLKEDMREVLSYLRAVK